VVTRCVSPRRLDRVQIWRTGSRRKAVRSLAWVCAFALLLVPRHALASAGVWLSASRVPRCETPELTIRMVHSMAGLGQSGGTLAFINRSGEACTLHGWPKLQGLTAAGRVSAARHVRAGSVGAAAIGVPTVILAPHHQADAVFVASDGSRTGAPCPPSYHHLRITPPGAVKSVVISAWIPYLNAYLPSCLGIEASPIIPTSALGAVR
jgi:hypothetical protein